MNGIFLIDKRAGCTSRDVVDDLMRKTETTKVGHTGTLDPIATGVLVVCVGKATKLVKHLTATTKEYLAEITLGIETDSFDPTGKVLSEQVVELTDEEIIEVVNGMAGEYEQEVPMYSAVKINGKKLYEYARAGEEVELPKRMVNILNIKLVGDIKRENGKVVFQIQCTVSKGTYIRGLVRDIAFKLNTVGIMTALRRLKQGPFSIEECKPIEDVVLGDMKTIKYALGDVPAIYVSEMLKKDILNGKIITNIYNSDDVVFLDEEDNVLALYHVYEKDETKLKPYVMVGGIK